MCLLCYQLLSKLQFLLLLKESQLFATSASDHLCAQLLFLSFFLNEKYFTKKPGLTGQTRFSLTCLKNKRIVVLHVNALLNDQVTTLMYFAEVNKGIL